MPTRRAARSVGVPLSEAPSRRGQLHWVVRLHGASTVATLCESTLPSWPMSVFEAPTIAARPGQMAPIAGCIGCEKRKVLQRYILLSVTVVLAMAFTLGIISVIPEC